MCDYYDVSNTVGIVKPEVGAVAVNSIVRKVRISEAYQQSAGNAYISGYIWKLEDRNDIFFQETTCQSSRSWEWNSGPSHPTAVSSSPLYC